MKLVVFGATGGTGSRVVERAVARGHDVTAFVRDPSKVAAKVRIVKGNVTDAREVEAAIAGHDAALSSLGPRKGSPPGTLISDATRAMVGALGGKRFVLESGLMVGDQRGLGFVSRGLVRMFRRFNHALFVDKLLAESIVKGSAASWVIVRPPNLDDQAPRGTYRSGVDLDVSVTKKMSHTDVADAMLDALANDAWTGQTIELSV